MSEHEGRPVVTHPAGRPIRVLVADDEEMVRTGFRMILEARQDIVVVGEAVDGVACVEAARRLRPDVCLVDVQMPRLDGLAVTRRLTGGDGGEPLRVVVVTTFHDEDYLCQALRSGAHGFVLKTGSSALLVEAVRAAACGDALVSPAMTLPLLRRMVLEGAPPPSALDGALSERELALVRLVAHGLTNKEIADRLLIAVPTVKSHLTKVHTKLGVRNRVELAAWAWRTGLAEPGTPLR
ncbi:response regulator transcription factor [Streptomyces sp. NPDC001941]|uniref:response regulator transcription factor n=1 Tax=Streptomyces sp. NPDC001941 TaxID=3154659 RepID=UPI00332AAC14